MPTRRLVLIPGDGLDRNSDLLNDLDSATDVILMAEVESEIRPFPNHIARVTFFLSAMRHFAAELTDAGFTVEYQKFDDDDATSSLVDYAKAKIRQHKPQVLAFIRPGRHSLLEDLNNLADESIAVEVYEDHHFLSTPDEFLEWASGRKSLVMEYFYRDMRKRHGYLMSGDEPVGGRWNYDDQNRRALGKDGPEDEPAHRSFTPDSITQEVIQALLRSRSDWTGSIAGFDWPVTRRQALDALDHFVTSLLPRFGVYQDAMTLNHPYLYHSRLSAALNVKLLNPREVVEAAIAAYRDGDVPINSVEGFVRQIIGWREFMRGIYWREMPGYESSNALEASNDLPAFFWNAETGMNCVRSVVQQLLETAYAHHIQRLMVTGLFGLLYSVDPRQMHDWFMGMHVDSVEWVTMPNVIGMSQFADGGVVATKPYVASGKYIKRMSNYCDACEYNPDAYSGDDACPFTTLYWTFLDRHEETLRSNHRMTLQLRNLTRKSATERKNILDRADRIPELIAASDL